MISRIPLWLFVNARRAARPAARSERTGNKSRRGRDFYLREEHTLPVTNETNRPSPILFPAPRLLKRAWSQGLAKDKIISP